MFFILGICIYSIGWNFIAFFGESGTDYVLLDLINDDYSYTVPSRILEEFNK